jgi:hypothetical protein
MKILRSVNRRGFSVGPAGWFTILRPNTWFPASRLPGAFHGSRIQTDGEPKPGPNALNGSHGQVRAISWQAIEPTEENRHLMRSSSIILGAVAITSALLWWIMHP